MSRTIAMALTLGDVEPLRCVFYDPDVVDLDDRLTTRAFEACDRADVNVFAVDDETVVVSGERMGLDDAIRALALSSANCIAVGARLQDAPVSAVWVGPSDLEVRGANVKVAEEDDMLLYNAVIAELAAR
jgi:hypothetical protein